MSIPISFITAIASDRTELGLVPALKTSKPPPPSARNNPSPIWLRAELPVHSTRSFCFVISCTPSVQAFCVRQVSTLANTPPYHLRLIHSATLTKEISHGTPTR